jgi:SAM-dependent methyltransferase
VSQNRRASYLTRYALKYFYPDTPTDFEHFAAKIRHHLDRLGTNPEPYVIQILDLGPGVGLRASLDWRGKNRIVVGVDPDPRVFVNPYLDERLKGDAHELPFKEAVFDAVVSVNVMEHFASPLDILKEVQRVLKPGGLFLVKTPSLNHYAARIAAWTPTWFHKWYNARRGRQPQDTLATVYAFNRVEEIERIAQETGFIVQEIQGFEGVPEYLTLSILLFIPGVCYERWVNQRESRSRYRSTLEVVLRKP